MTTHDADSVAHLVDNIVGNLVGGVIANLVYDITGAELSEDDAAPEADADTRRARDKRVERYCREACDRLMGAA